MKFIPRSEATRQAIIEATADLFNRQGYAGTSITDIEKATKLTKGSIYGNFANKEEVAMAAFDHNLSTLQGVIQHATSMEPTYKGKLLAYISVYYGISNRAGCPMMNTAIEADDTHEGLRQKAADGLIAWKQDVAALIRKGITNKEFKPDIDVEKTALTIIALVKGAILLGKATQSPVYLDKVLGVAKETILNICL